MKTLRMRPSFELEVPPDHARVMELLEWRIRARNAKVRGWVQHDQAELHLRHAEQFFSPVLHVSLLREGGAARLQCRFGPLPQVWLVFVGLYFLIALAGVAMLMWGASQWMIGRTPWALWGGPASVAVFAFVYGAAFIGQGLASEQMYVLRAFVDRALEDAGPEHAARREKERAADAAGGA